MGRPSTAARADTKDDPPRANDRMGKGLPPSPPSGDPPVEPPPAPTAP